MIMENSELQGESVDLKGQMELNEKVARLCGYAYKHTSPFSGRKIWYIPNDIICTTKLHDYCNDLNAMHEAEKVILALSDGVAQPDPWDDYASRLGWGASVSIHATARQRAEAFIAVMESGMTQGAGVMEGARDATTVSKRSAP